MPLHGARNRGNMPLHGAHGRGNIAVAWDARNRGNMPLYRVHGAGEKFPRLDCNILYRIDYRHRRKIPKTFPRIWQSSTMMGAMVSFSGWRRICPSSL